MLWAPHTARIFTRVEGQEVETGETLPGKLKRLSVEDALMKWGITESEAATFKFDYNRFADVKVGYRLLVDGETWEVSKGPIRRNTIVRLENCQVGLVRVV